MAAIPKFPRIAASLLAGALLAAADAGAQSIWKCVDAQGNVAYQQTACGAAQRGENIVLAPPRATAPDPAEPAAKRAPPARAARTTRGTRPASAAAMSFECRSQAGAVFYRHARCPASIQRRDAGSRSGTAGDRVSATRLPRAEACRRMRAAGRDGHEHDETVSTYERNLGRDPCRRH